MTVNLQKYQLRLTRGSDGLWTVTGYWEIPNPHKKKSINWILDGAPRMFHTRKEALEFLMTVKGVPE